MRAKVPMWKATAALGVWVCALSWAVADPLAQQGSVLQTPATPMELPVEIEIELAPAASLKQAPLWKELYQLLVNPYALDCTPLPARPGQCRTIAPFQRRPGFGVAMPPLNVWSPDYNFLTAQPLRLRTSDGEVSWDVPGPLFDPDEVVPANAFNVPTALRTPIGALVACPAPGVPGNPCAGAPAGSLVVSNSPVAAARAAAGFGGNGLGPGASDSRIPPHRTVVAVLAVRNGRLQELNGTSTRVTMDVDDLEIPINEEDFFRPTANFAGVPVALRPYVGRRAAEILGKSLFWDMQMGSDGVQACGSCHFNAGADNRTRNQLNPNHLASPSDGTLQVASPNGEVTAASFPFRKLANPDLASEGDPSQVVVHDFNDVMSSMGVSRFAQFVDVPPIGSGSFGPIANGVRPLLPDLADFTVPEPLPQAFTDALGRKLRRVEPRNTPTMHGAAFNLDNFWDGRARFIFNGGSVFGPSDPQAHIFIGPVAGALSGATNGDLRDDLLVENPEVAAQPVRIKFSSLGSQAVGPPLSEFEMSFLGRNWPKIGKKLLQPSPLQLLSAFGDPPQGGLVWQVIPLANQLVSPTDSILGPFSAQRSTPGGPVNRPGRPGLNISYPALIRLAFHPLLWQNASHHLNGTACADPFDSYCLAAAPLPAVPTNRNQFTQMEANFSLFAGLAIQAYEELLIPDDTPFDRFMDLNPLAANGVGQPGEQAVLFPTLVPSLVGGGLQLVPDNPATPEYDGFGPEEIFGFDIFAGGNLTAALPMGSPRNPAGFGSNPFTRNARCMMCHLGPEQTDHSINVSHGLLKGDAEFEFPTPPSTGLLFAGAGGNTAGLAVPPVVLEIPSAEPPGPLAVVPGLILAEEVEETPQDAVEVEPRDFKILDDPATPWDDRVVGQPGNFAFGDQGIYNVGVRPTSEDPGRGGDDPFGWPLSTAALTLKNIGGAAFEPCDSPTDSCVMANVDPTDLGGTFEETGDELPYPGAPNHTLESVNPGFERSPQVPQLPAYMAPWINGLPAGELHPQIDEMAGMAPNTITPPNGGPAVEFPEVHFGADLHCGIYNPVAFGAGAPNFGWGPRCPTNQSGVAGNFEFAVHGTWPVPNRVLRQGAFKAPPLRNVELTGPFFHTGSYLTLRQVVDFYLRGGDFPVTNADNRDPNLVNVAMQSFGFGRTAGPGLGLVDHLFSADPPFTLAGNFADALPDTIYLYDAMPDLDHPLTPEPATTNLESAKVALVKFLLAMTDPRVKYERAPFDRPEIFVPIDGLAPENTGGRAQLLLQSAPSPVCDGAACFRRIPEVGAAGNPTPVPAFLGVTNNPAANCTTEISHFCP